MSRPLSPAAEAAWEACNDVMEHVGVFDDCGHALAAALYAVAPHLPNDCRTLCRIAAELEATDG